MAVAYMSYPDVCNVAGTSKLNRARLEGLLVNRKIAQLADRIAAFGVKKAGNETTFKRLVADILLLDQRATAPLWTMLEKRYVAMAENDFRVLAESDRMNTMQKIIRFSSRHLPEVSQDIVLGELTNLVKVFFTESSLALQALELIFESCKALPTALKVKALRNIMLNLPFIRASPPDPNTERLVAALQNESLKLDTLQRDALEHELNQAHDAISDFHDALREASRLPAAQQGIRLADVIDQIATAPTLYVERMINDVVDHFAADPRQCDADLLTRLVPMVVLIENVSCRADQLQTMLQSVEQFASAARVVPLQHFAAIALTLPEHYRKAAFVSLCVEVGKLDPADRPAVLSDVVPLIASLSIVERIDLLSQVPLSIRAVALALVQSHSIHLKI